MIFMTAPFAPKLFKAITQKENVDLAGSYSIPGSNGWRLFFFFFRPFYFIGRAVVGTFSGHRRARKRSSLKVYAANDFLSRSLTHSKRPF